MSVPSYLLEKYRNSEKVGRKLHFESYYFYKFSCYKITVAPTVIAAKAFFINFTTMHAKLSGSSTYWLSFAKFCSLTNDFVDSLRVLEFLSFALVLFTCLKLCLISFGTIWTNF